MALAERQRKSFGEDWAHVSQANGELKEKKKITHIFKAKFPVNYRKISSNHLIFPWKFKHFCYDDQWFRYGENDIFRKNAQNAGAVFPPTGCLRANLNALTFRFGTYHRRGNMSSFLMPFQWALVRQVPFLTEKLEVFHYGDEDEGHSEENFICPSYAASKSLDTQLL